MITRLFAAISVFQFVSTAAGLPTIGEVQSVAVRGKLICQTLPAANVTIKLWDNDRFDIDDLMATTTSEEDGRFEVAGKETEVTAIDPKVNIYHRCGDPKMICVRKLTIFIPDEWISRGSIPKKTFDLGVLVLDAVFAGEVTDCIH
ncbi:Transthyretin-like family-containing protein [Aphelenchoides fujianensis]|nr:Transthyretin-like family-containing protein [Aphelenchoides fujianensis]